MQEIKVQILYFAGLRTNTIIFTWPDKQQPSCHCWEADPYLTENSPKSEWQNVVVDSWTVSFRQMENVSLELEPQCRVKQIINICCLSQPTFRNPNSFPQMPSNFLTFSADMSIYHRNTCHWARWRTYFTPVTLQSVPSQQKEASLISRVCFSWVSSSFLPPQTDGWWADGGTEGGMDGRTDGGTDGHTGR